MKVLLVDDNEELREFLVQCLTESSIEVESVSDGTRAMAHAENEKFDAYIIDSLLGEADGLSLVAQLRATKTGQKMPILIMSNLGTSLARRMAKRCRLRRVFGQAVWPRPIHRTGAGRSTKSVAKRPRSGYPELSGVGRAARRQWPASVPGVSRGWRRGRRKPRARRAPREFEF